MISWRYCTFVIGWCGEWQFCFWHTAGDSSFFTTTDFDFLETVIISLLWSLSNIQPNRYFCAESNVLRNSVPTKNRDCWVWFEASHCSYSQYAGFKPWPGYQLPWLRFPVFLLIYSKNACTSLHWNRPHSHPSKSLPAHIHYSFDSI
jgi:hypothetical protein